MTATRAYDPALAKDLVLHIDDIFHQRINIFLVAESIFFAAVAAGWQAPQALLTPAICSLGIVFTLCLWHTLVRLKAGLDWLIEQLKTLDSSGLYQDYTELGLRGLSSASVFTWLLPSVTVAFWLFVLFLSLCRLR